MPPSLHKTGAYRIVNAVNGKVYVGGAYRSLRQRKSQHWSDLRAGRSHNKHLQAAWNKYGEAAFRFEVLERCPEDQVEVVEQKWLDRLRPWERGVGYNQCRTAESVKGHRWKLTDEQKEHHRRMGNSPENLARLATLRKGRKHSEETKRHWSEVRKGRKPSGQARANHQVAMAKFKGKKRDLSPEAREAMAERGRRSKGCKRSEEFKENLRRLWADPEHRARMSIALKKARAKGVSNSD